MGGTGFGIDTLFKPNANTTRFVIDFQCTKKPAADELLFGEYGTNVSGIGMRFFNLFAVNSTSLGYRDNSNAYSTLVPPSITARMVFDYDCPNGTATLGGVSKALNKGDYTLAYSAFFGSPASGDKVANYKLYSSQIYTNDSKIKDFVPCKNPSGVIGLYDLVDKAFHANAHSGALIAGPEVETGKVWVESTVSESMEYTFTADRDRELTAAFVSTLAFNPTWTLIGTPSGGYWQDMCFGNGKFVAISASGFGYSADGAVWNNATVTAAGSSTAFYRVVYGDGLFCAVDHTYTRYSYNGTSWTNDSSSPNSQKLALAYGDGKYIAITNDSGGSYSYYSHTGKSFAYDGKMPSKQTYNYTAYGSGKFVTVSYGSNIAAYLVWGAGWKETTLPATDNWFRIAYGGGKFVAVAYDSDNAAYSSDGITWTLTKMPSKNTWQALAYGGGMFVAIAYNSDKVAYSADGVLWSEAENRLPGAYTWIAVAYGNGRFVALANNSNAIAYTN